MQVTQFTAAAAIVPTLRLSDLLRIHESGTDAYNFNVQYNQSLLQSIRLPQNTFALNTSQVRAY